MMFEIIVEVGSMQGVFEVTVTVDNVDSESEAKQEAEEYVRDNMYIVATSADEVEE